MEKTIVFGEELEAPTREELKKMMLERLMKEADSIKQPSRELATKRVDAKLAAKQRL